MTTDSIKIYKFGGASVKNAAAFRNLANIVKSHGGERQLLLVVSAMGKSTNALELVMDQAYKQEDFEAAFQQSKAYHFEVVQELFPEPESLVYHRLEELFLHLHSDLQRLLPTDNYDKAYDQMVGYGELLSSTILHHYLQEQQLANTWVDSRKYIQTDDTWREAKIDWPSTERLIKRDLLPLLEQQLVVTQGFLGGTKAGLTTTLGREGSDFSAAIFAYSLDAGEMCIWKDVEGLLNADPKHFRDTVCYTEISYQETVEMAYYGASVIHPKTIKPLANKQIPLYVKSFLNPTGKGTKICDCRFDKPAPAYIIKENQCLISFGVKDFTFISEKNLEAIFNALSELRIKINMMQNSAISFSVCSDFHEERLHCLIQILKDQFIIHYNTALSLFTVKNYDSESVNRLTENKEILLEQRTRTTYQFVSR
ncbi:aspartate kinase [Pontibacter diazotrophicus]|uniref:Aspartokinase n=1 Tax=Pontibacter diazotrophicus TaxID=1400979 RepID=A0A3D8L7N2_9BACT|nr:aspartate kinase [Pontibacter diazotrophicus]RDV13408.1 aspartate kinase [Pontibacter diazotrophicus]